MNDLRRRGNAALEVGVGGTGCFGVALPGGLEQVKPVTDGGPLKPPSGISGPVDLSGLPLLDQVELRVADQLAQLIDGEFLEPSRQPPEEARLHRDEFAPARVPLGWL